MNTSTCRLFVIALLLLITSHYGANAQVHAQFSANVTKACSPLVVRFTDQSTGNPTSWKWELGNGNISTQQNPGAVYLQPGFKTVRLIVSDGVTSDTLVMPNYIEVYQNPTANFGTLNVQGCTPYNACFTDSTRPGSGAITHWLWDFGDGQSDSVKNPCVSYATPGNFSISLFVTDTNGCNNQLTIPSLVKAAAPPVAAFSSNNNSSCTAPLNVTFQNTSQSLIPLSYIWWFGDGTSSSLPAPSHTYSQPGTYDVMLRVVNNYGCVDTEIKPHFVAIEQLVAKFSAPQTGCIGNSVQFTDSSTSNPNTWRWSFGDGDTSRQQNPQHIYRNAGSYTVKMFAANSTCSDSITKTSYITIAPSPNADFSSTTRGGCNVPYNATFTDQSVGATAWTWNFGDTTFSNQRNPQHTYTHTGIYTVSLTVTSANGCTNTVAKTAYINVVKPKALFSGDTIKGCIPLTTKFTSASTSVEPIVSYLWIFGDGTTSTLASPSHTYIVDTTYTVTLIIINAGGCTDTLVKTDYIKAGSRPMTAFFASPRQSCLYTPIQFTDTSAIGDQWLWSFGDGSSSLDQNPKHTYSDTGYFDIKLIVFHNGCSDTLKKPAYVHIAPPHAIFDVVYDCANPLAINFTDRSLAPTSWYWSFGDSTNSSLQNPHHTYAAKGTYTVTLMVTDTVSGCFDIFAKPLTITQPKAIFTDNNTSGCKPFTTSLIDSSVDAVAWKWTSSNTTSLLKNPTFNYNLPGTYDVTLVVTDVNGCKDTLTKPEYIVVKGPSADFSGTPLNGCAPLVVHFSDSSKHYLSNIVSWKWKFGDGDSSSLQNPSHLYQNTGSYTVSLTVTDAAGCTHSITYSNLVKPTFPSPLFSGPTFTCTGKDITFTNTSVGNNPRYLWTFGDGDSSTAVTPTHHYNTQGTFTVSLKVIDANGCDSTLVKPNYVTVRNPIAAFAADSVFASCPPLIVNFRDTSTGTPVAWHWDFGDGTSSVLANPSHVYNVPGQFKVTLTITTALGCTDSVAKSGFVVVNGPSGTYTFAPHHTCEGSYVEFRAVTSSTAVRTWDFGDGHVQNGADTLMHLYDSAGVYHPILVLDDGLGCVRPLPSPDSVLVEHLKAAFIASPPYLCHMGSVTFTDQSTTSTPITSWLWDFGDSTTANIQNPTHIYNVPGQYIVKMKIGNGSCVDSALFSSIVTVDPGPQVSFDPSAFQHCVPFNAQFNNTTTSDSAVAFYAWDLGNGQTDTMRNTTALYDTAGTYHVSLIVMSVTGCAGRADTNLTVHPLPTITTTRDTGICIGNNIKLHATGGNRYAWSPTNTLSDSTAENPIATPLSDEQYNVTVTDLNGCVSQDSVSIIVNPLPVVTINPDRVICSGVGIELWATGGTYEWSPTATLSCDTCSNPVASPLVNTEYKVKVSNQFGCFVFDSTHVTVNPVPAGITNHHVSICKNDSVKLVSVGGTTHNWNPGAGLSCTNCASPMASPDSTTTYALDIYNQFQCGFTDTVLVTVNPLPVLSITAPDSICKGATANIVATGATTYAWTPAATLSCANCDQPVATPTTTTTYHLIGTNIFGCKSTDNVTIGVNPVPQLSTIADAKLCVGDVITLTTTSVDADNFVWSPAAGLNDSSILSPVARPTLTTTYTLDASNHYGCTNSTAVTIASIGKVLTAINGDTSICLGQTVQLHTDILQTGTKGTLVIWTPINGLESTTILNPVAKPMETQQYTLMAFSGACIPDTQHVTITVNKIPSLTIASTRPVVENTTVVLTPQAPDDIVKYEWTPADGLSCSDCSNPQFNATETTMFNVRITDVHGCQNNADVLVNVVGDCAKQVFVPNYFSPNGDDKNDKLYVRGLGLTSLKVFRVFDRWGNQVFETKDINEGWNGVYRGQALESGVFVYYVESICTNGETAIKQGNTTLMR